MGATCSCSRQRETPSGRRLPVASPAAVLGGAEAHGCPAAAFYGRCPLPLRERAEWGQAAREAGCSAYPVRRTDLQDRPQVTLAISHTGTARQLLARHDGRAARVYKDKPTAGPINALLAHSLTYASPEDWPRQRQAVKMAVGSTVATAVAFQAHTARCSAEFGNDLRSIAAASAATQETVVDLREPVYHAACRLLCGIILGPGTIAVQAADVLYRLKRTYGESRMATGKRAKQIANESADRAAELEGIVRSVAAQYCSSSATDTPAVAKHHAQAVSTAVPLIQRLAGASATQSRSPPSTGGGIASFCDSTEAQQDRHATPPLLTIDEVVSNVHSFMLAGFETTAILVLFTLLHLAHDKTMQIDCAMEAAEAALTLGQPVDELQCADHRSGRSSTPGKQRSSGRLVEAVLKETLRLYPPVLSLPRVVAAPDFSKPENGQSPTLLVPPIEMDAPGHSGNSPVPVPLRPGQTITICTAAAARAGWTSPDYWMPRRFLNGIRQNDRGSDSDDEFSDSDDSDDISKGEMIVFGVGPRACPAGSLSVLLAREPTNAALNAVEIHPPPGRPADGLLPSFPDEDATSRVGSTTTGRRRQVEYYWEADIRALPVLALTAPANVSLKQR